MRRRYALVGVLAAEIILSGALLSTIVIAPPEPLQIALTPATVDMHGVATDSTFAIEANKPLDPAAVKTGLTIQPEASFDVQGAGRRLVLYPSQPLQPEQTYEVSLDYGGRSFHWSFQTRIALRALGTLPRDGGTDVPITTGIEIQFNDEDFVDAQPYFSIAPAVAGLFEVHKDTLVFVPTQQLLPGTSYRVTLSRRFAVRGGGPSLANDVSFSFSTAGVREQQQAGLLILAAATEFSTKDAPAFLVYAPNEKDIAGQSVQVSLYRYPSAAAFIQAAHGPESTNGADLVTRFTATPRQGLPDAHYVDFPAPLPAGYYVASAFDLRSAGKLALIRFQVTDVSFFVSLTRTKTLVWLNDLATGAPLSDARLISAGATIAQSDASGLAVFSTRPVESDKGVGFEGVAVAADSREAVVRAAAPQLDSGPMRPELYWRYVYVDRPIYKPWDTVNFWGLIAPREKAAAPIANVTVVIKEEYRERDLLRVAVPMAGSVFTGSLALPYLHPSFYALNVYADDVLLTSSTVRVDTYAKPNLILELAADKRAVIAGDDVKFSARARFFEGTPAAGFRLNVKELRNRTADVVTTDVAGDASFHYAAAAGCSPTCDMRVEISSDTPELGEVNANVWVRVFSSAVTVVPVSSVAGGKATFKLTLRAVRLDQLNAGASQDASLGPPLANQTISGSLTRQEWAVLENGEAYDFISKQVVKRYRYEDRSAVIDSFSSATDANGVVTYTFAVDPDRSYRLDFRAADSSGRVYAGAAWTSGREYDPHPSNPQLTLSFDKSSWKIGDTVQATYKRGENALPSRPNGFLFYTLRLGLARYQVQSDPVYSVPFREEDVPNFFLRGVYFDGRSYLETCAGSYWWCSGAGVVRFDQTQRALTVKVLPDKAEYRPGETVTVAVEAADPLGRPASATVNLNVVDEAIYAIAQESVRLLDSLYVPSVPADEVITVSSHRFGPLPTCQCAFGGGGGPEPVRSFFPDAVIFRTIALDNAGKGQISFKLPDNLTTWRLTYQAVTQRLEAASGTVPLRAKLPFFADMVIADAYRAGDAPVITARVNGEKLKIGDTATLDIALSGPVSSTAKFSTRAFEGKPFELPPLAAGDYTLTLTATGPNGMSDAVRRTLHVQDSFLRRGAVDFLLVRPTTRVTGAARGLTTLRFADYERSSLFSALYVLHWGWGNRLEQQVARFLSALWLRDSFSEATLVEPVDMDRYRSGRGVGILPYASADPELTAKLADLMPEPLRADPYYFGELYKAAAADGRARSAIVALYGLAVAGQPDAAAMQAYAGRADLTQVDRLWLGLAFARSGDEGRARQLLDGALASAEKIGAGLRLPVATDYDDALKATALAAVLAARLGSSSAIPLLRYVAANRPKEILTDLEQLLAIQALLAKLPQQPVSLTYTLSGRTTTRQIDPKDVFTLVLQPAEVAGLSFSATGGDVGVTITYDAPLQLDEHARRADFGLTRTYAWVGSLLKITLHPTFPSSTPNGSYEIDDVLPAGLLPVDRPWDYGQARDSNVSVPMRVEGQRVSFWAWPGMKDIVYWGRRVNGGLFKAEPAIIEHMESGGVWAWSEPAEVKVTLP